MNCTKCNGKLLRKDDCGFGLDEVMECENCGELYAIAEVLESYAHPKVR